MKLKIKKIIQVFMPIILFSLYNIKAMDQNIDFYLKNLPHDVVGEILGYIANPKSISNVTQANIDKIKDLRKDESNENKLSGIAKFLEVLKKSTCDYLEKFKDKPEILIEEAIELDTEFSKECLKRLINTDSKIAKKVNDFFKSALLEGELETVKFLIEAGANPNISSYNEVTALMEAIVRENEEMVKFLLKAEANPNIKNQLGGTSLISAVIQKNPRIVKLLLKNEADPDMQMNDGYTALMLAALHNYKKIVKLLLDAEADPNIKNKNGKTASEIAFIQGYKDIANFIKKYEKSILSSALDKGYEYISSFIKK